MAGHGHNGKDDGKHEQDDEPGPDLKDNAGKGTLQISSTNQ